MKCPTPWLGNKRGYLTDWITQRWVCLTGRSIEPASHEWLLGPVGDSERIGSEFFERLAATYDCVISKDLRRAGFMENFVMLRSDNFDPAGVAPHIVRFYESTSDFDLDVWPEWSGLFRPFGWLLCFLFSRRLQQLNMPIYRLDTNCGITSDIIRLLDRETRKVRFTGWLRTMIGSGDVIYVALYSICTPPKQHKPCMKVIFPLPNGHATVIMKPETCADGSLKFHSTGNSFGDTGFYFVVRNDQGRVWARYVRTMKESIHVYPDSNGQLRADHVLKIFGLVFLRLHYRITTRLGQFNDTASSTPTGAAHL